MAETKPKSKAKPKSKKRKPPVKNHFKEHSTDSVLIVGTIRGVQTDIETVRENASAIKMVGEKEKHPYNSRETTIEGDALQVFLTSKAIFFVPPCGENGFAFTQETWAALVKAVSASQEKVGDN